jgi:uncharacterized protein (TIGR02453 family)
LKPLPDAFHAEEEDMGMPLSKDTLDFLVENRMRNDRPWYNDHKREFSDKVLEPLKELVMAMTPAMREIDPLFELAPKVDRTISRIYRDTRFTHDKSLFRDVMWIVFQRAKIANPEGMPGYWFEISPSRFAYGCGFYQASNEFLGAMRQRILAEDPLFLKARDMYERQDVFELEGEMFKRSKYPGLPEPLRFWLDRKSVSLSAYSTDFKLAFSDRLAEKLTADFRMIRPMYEFWCAVEGERERE